MKYGIVSDIHGNLEALMTVLSYLRDKVSSYICSGDIVGYGPYPNECVEVMRTLEGLILVAGNHDLGAVGMKDIAELNSDARTAIIWTSKVLNPENREYLRNLKCKVEEKKFTVVHGSPQDPTNEYLLDSCTMEKNLSFFNTALCFIGHSHIPLYYHKKKIEILGDDERINPEEKAIVNLGSVGQPRDRNPMASFGIYDDEKGEIEIKRLSYDIRKTQEAMIKVDLPPFLIIRLTIGM
ncbi:hypothetical protein AUJ66_08140 [Candidatus Desantisbacteria bacterium CG1_02_38_46]|uniref:Metallophosphoesterase n=3 Tax=unclassified Candidatus Desantisiibacteriota TaxID=3106372 RepID=A0A2H9PCP9_9BACT|nr:MAG: hypothetical protein AUJ66_08140 [Candidatus Desantisbacteria bacterium CG1_02_38_46]PIU51468.1 MAG: metallophosphoesterase [Candidatus Desantisbacteria bacterium CG07_land_8_20_14_0_80_39_15]PIZ17066.1 MAG: metallophosphoesterase [Candidatus Desantisbacteria bacterium CG_4_10_14_0_8_um_filter_39_17]